MIDKEIIKIASNTENHGVLNNHTHFSKLKNAICGDEMKIYLIVQNDSIKDLKYECQSCIYCQASVSLLSRKVKNQSVKKIKIFAEQVKNCFESESNPLSKEWNEFGKIMKKNNISRKECLLLPIKTTIDALNKKNL